MRIRGIIFDLDGTLAETIPVCLTAFREALTGFGGRGYSDAEIISLFGPSEEGIIQQIVGDGWEAQHRAFLEAYEREHVACPLPADGVLAVLDLLRERGIRSAIVTGKGSQSAAISLRVLGLAPYFEIVETGSPDGSVKPDAIRRITERWGMLAEHVAYAGDSPHDTRDARAAGVLAIGAGWAPSTDLAALRASEPDELFTTVADLARWIERDVDA